MPKGQTTKRKGVRGDKLLGVKARAKIKSAEKHKKYMAKLASHNYVKKTSKVKF